MNILHLFTIFAVSQAHFKHYDIIQSNGLIFDKISKVHTIEKYWHIIYYFDLNPLADDINSLNACINELNIICMNSKITCRLTTDLLNEKIADLTSEKLTDKVKKGIPIVERNKRNAFQALSSEYKSSVTITNQNKNRKKRNSFVNFVNDAFFEDDLHKQLTHLESKLANTNKISQGHLTLINHTVSLYNNSFESVQDRLSKLERKIILLCPTNQAKLKIKKNLML